MIDFQAGSGPDTQAVGIALEEMFLDYRLAPGRSPLPVIAIGGARIVGAENILPALARKTGRFLAEGAVGWLKATPIDLEALNAQLAERDYILGGYSIADMSAYPRLVPDQKAVADYPAVRRWIERVQLRPETQRGLGIATS